MQLFQLRNYNVIFEPQTMMIKEFAAIRDKNKDDDLTLKEISFVWFFTDVKSDFSNILDEKERTNVIKEEISLPPSWRLSKEVKNAIEVYREYSKTPSSGLYNASIIAAQYIEKKLRNPKELLAELDSKGNPLYKIDTILRMIKDVPQVMENLHKAREQVIREIEEKNELRGSKEKAVFEDGI